MTFLKVLIVGILSATTWTLLASDKPNASKEEKAHAPAAAEKADDSHGKTDAHAKTDEKHATKEGENAPPIAAIRQSSHSTSGCLADQAAIDDLKKRRMELESKSKELTTKEAELAAREQALNEELKKLEVVRDEISKVEDTQKKVNEEKLAKLVETIEGMGPKPAAQLLITLDEGLAVSAIGRISTQKLSKIMSAMDPARSSRLTEILAGVARANKKSASNGAAVAARTKGGEENNGNTNESSIDASANAGSSAKPTQPDVQREPGSTSTQKGK